MSDVLPVPGVDYSLSTDGTKWRAPGRTDLRATGIPPFVIGTTYPDETNVGAGIIRPWPVSTVSGVQTYSTSQTINDKVFHDLVIVNNSAIVTFENCVFLGPLTRVSGANLVRADQGSRTTLRYCTIDPQTPSAYWNGVGYSRYTLEMCEVKNCTDTLAAFALSTSPIDTVGIRVYGSWLHSMSRFAPDYADPGGRPETHNDLIQCQGNIGPADDILIDGCRMDATHSTTAGQPEVDNSDHIQLSAVMLTPVTRDRVAITVRNSWLTNGVFTVNATANTNGSSILVLDNNKYEKPHASTGGPSAAIAIYSGLTNRSITNQTYLVDGTPVPIYTPP